MMGLPGTAKTIIAQQYTFTNASPDRPAVYFSTLSEPLEKIVRFGQTLDFFDTAAVGRSVFYEDLGQVGSRDGLAGVSDHVAAVLRERRPGLVVIDSFKALHALAADDAEFRWFLHQLAGRLTAYPAGSLWVGEYDQGDAMAAAEFAVADAVVELAVVPLGQREKRFLRVRKLRGSDFRSGQHGYRLTGQGLCLFPRLADIPAEARLRLDRLIEDVLRHVGHSLQDGAAMLLIGLGPGELSDRGRSAHSSAVLCPS
jgi:circadian clock protein KaiC